MLATKEVIAETFQPLPLYLAAAGITGCFRHSSSVCRKPWRFTATAAAYRGSAAGVEADQGRPRRGQFILVEYQHAHAPEGRR